MDGIFSFFVDGLETIVVRKQRAPLPAQHNPISVHILIKTMFQIRCLHAQQVEECIRLHSQHSENKPQTCTTSGNLTVVVSIMM